MYNWHAKIHKSGTRVAVFNGAKLVKVVESSKDTFEPAEAQKFAEDLVSTLQERTSSQMAAPSAAPSVTNGTELQNKSMEVANSQASGEGAGEGAAASEPSSEVSVEVIEDNENDEDKLASENENLRSVVAGLKKKLAQERNDRTVERKARRGLAIAKQLVADGKLEDSYDSVKQKVAEIVKLEDNEIDRLERKVAGEHEFESVDDAQRELRRQARIARINRQAAAEAQEDGDEEQADSLDKRADEAEIKMEHIQQVIDDMGKSAEGEAEEATEKPAENVEEEEKADEAVPATTEKPAGDAESTASNDSTEKLAALARKYRSIAANHRKLAESAEAEGDIESADKQDAMGDEAEEKAEDVEKKLAEAPVDDKVAEVSPETEESEKGAVEETDEAAPAEETEKKKETAKKEPGQTVTSDKHQPLKRDDGESVEEFGIDKNASLVEENDFSHDPEVEILSRMWRGAPIDE